MSDLRVRPGIGIGPVEIGMTRDEASAAATAAGMTVEDFRRVPGSSPADLALDGCLFAYTDGDGRVSEVEVATAPAGDRHTVSCLDLDLGASYEAVLERMRAHGRVDETDPEHPGTSVFFELGLSLWADAGVEDLPDVQVEAILVRRPEPYPLD